MAFSGPTEVDGKSNGWINCHNDHCFATNRFPRLVKLVYQMFVAALCVAVFVSFVVYAPFSFGYPSLSKPTIMSLALVDTWDLLMRN